MDSLQAVNRVGEACGHRLVVIAIFSSLATLLIASIYPSGRPADELMSLSFGSTYFWIAAQSFALTLPGLILGTLVGTFSPRAGAVLGGVLILAVPHVVLCDVMTFTWIAERFLSATMTRIVTSLLPALALHVTPAAMVQAVLVAALSLFASWVAWKSAGALAGTWKSRESAIQPLPTTIVLSFAAALTSFSALRTMSVTVDEMSRCSARHPFCAFHIVGYRGVGVSVPTNQAAVLSRLRGLQASAHAQARERRQLAAEIDRIAFDPDALTKRNRKVILVVVECLRPEVIDPKLMPNLHAFAQKSIVCSNHFAAGNSTCLSMFSLVNGVEAIWFHRKVADQPIMNRILHQAGYRLAFYGGQTDWRHYAMDGFISPSQFDDFQIEEPELPQTDLRAVQRTLRFIDQHDEARANDGSQRGVGRTQPRAALCYLFGTHSSFRYSEPEFRVFQPEASEGLLISKAPELKEQFYNRYKNSVLAMDRILAPLLRDDCVVMVMGDHGEPFLDDGTAAHGTRLSRFQNMTPAVIYYPGVSPRTIDLPTFHADLLPTLLAILEIPIKDPGVFDGVDLVNSTGQELTQRTFVTRNFLDSTSMLVGPWSLDPDRPFGYRVCFDIWNWQSDYLNPIDEQGYEFDAGRVDAEQMAGKESFHRWMVNRFGEASADESSSREELFSRFIRSSDAEVRLAALRIAESSPDPEDYLYDLITGATRDPDAEIRTVARELLIRINRYRGRSQ